MNICDMSVCISRELVLRTRLGSICTVLCKSYFPSTSCCWWNPSTSLRAHYTTEDGLRRGHMNRELKIGYLHRCSLMKDPDKSGSIAVIRHQLIMQYVSETVTRESTARYSQLDRRVRTRWQPVMGWRDICLRPSRSKSVWTRLPPAVEERTVASVTTLVPGAHGSVRKDEESWDGVSFGLNFISLLLVQGKGT
jgi:hypothetical protein